jgi:hypothetical protein
MFDAPSWNFPLSRPMNTFSQEVFSSDRLEAGGAGERDADDQLAGRLGSSAAAASSFGGVIRFCSGPVFKLGTADATGPAAAAAGFSSGAAQAVRLKATTAKPIIHFVRTKASNSAE